MQVILQLVITFERIQWITYRSYILIAHHSALFQWKTRNFKLSPIYIENLSLCSQFVHLYTQVILAHVVHVHACFNAKFFLIAVLGWNFELLVTAGVLFVFFLDLKSLLLWRSCDTSKMIFGLLIWEGNIYLHSFTFWLSLSSEVINEGSSCFHMKISSLFFFCFCLEWSCFFYGWSRGKTGKCCFSWKLSWSQEFYPNWDAL